MRSRSLFLNLAAAAIALVAHLAPAQRPHSSVVDQAASTAVFSPVQNREPVISLDGLWRFSPGDNPQWASPNFDDSAWPLIRSDQSWISQGYRDDNGFARKRYHANPLSSLYP